MNDIVVTGLIMAGVYGISKLVKKYREKARARIEEQARGPKPQEPRNLGTLERTPDGSFAPEQSR
ncbi:MAG: hypothetical protein P1U69_10555 [Parvibaculaceae bacterium]|nr:hypothetical protein [Parvibaculaceae bacterium]|tara:strand:- start:390 stop:584 length:195 start_codon:yes stop_codon:yes gene_type:complete